jgi:FkbM family methyltransferase
LDYARYSVFALDAGVPVHRLSGLRHGANIIAALSHIDPRAAVSVVDVGAHQGQWALACLKALPGSRVLSFEPVSEFFEQAQRRAAGHARWRVKHLALGSRTESQTITVQGQRSSFLPLSGSQFVDWMVGSEATKRSELVEVDRLDAALHREAVHSVDLLKIDAEGFEREILAGADQSLQNTRVVLIEVRFDELFTGAPLFGEIDEMLRKRWGFVLAHLKPCEGQCLWADATYVRSR